MTPQVKVNEVAPSLNQPSLLLGSRTPMQLVAISNIKLNAEIFSSRSLSIHKRILVKNFLTLLYQLNPIEWIEEGPLSDDHDGQGGWMEQTLSAAGLAEEGDDPDHDAWDPLDQDDLEGALHLDERAARRRSFYAGDDAFPASNRKSRLFTSNSLSPDAKVPLPRPTSAELPQSLHSYLSTVFDVDWSVDLPNTEDSLFTSLSNPSSSSLASTLNFGSSSTSVSTLASTVGSRISAGSDQTQQDYDQEQDLIKRMLQSNGDSTPKHQTPNFQPHHSPAHSHQHQPALTRKSSLQKHSLPLDLKPLPNMPNNGDSTLSTPATSNDHFGPTALTKKPLSNKPTLVPGRRSSLLQTGNLPAANTSSSLLKPPKSPEQRAFDSSNSANCTNSTNNTPVKIPSPNLSPTISRRTSSLHVTRPAGPVRSPSNENLPPSPISPVSNGLPRPLNSNGSENQSQQQIHTLSNTQVTTPPKPSAKSRRRVSTELDQSKGASSAAQGSYFGNANANYTNTNSTLSPPAPVLGTPTSRSPPLLASHYHTTNSNNNLSVSPSTSPLTSPNLVPSSSPSQQQQQQQTSGSNGAAPVYSGTTSLGTPLLARSSSLSKRLPPQQIPASSRYPQQQTSNGHLQPPTTYARSNSENDIQQRSQPQQQSANQPLAKPNAAYHLYGSKSSPSLPLDSDFDLSSAARPLPALPTPGQYSSSATNGSTGSNGSNGTTKQEYQQYAELQKQFYTDSSLQSDNSNSNSMDPFKRLARSSSRSAMTISSPLPTISGFNLTPTSSNNSNNNSQNGGLQPGGAIKIAASAPTSPNLNPSSASGIQYLTLNEIDDSSTQQKAYHYQQQYHYSQVQPSPSQHSSNTSISAATLSSASNAGGKAMGLFKGTLSTVKNGLSRSSLMPSSNSNGSNVAAAAAVMAGASANHNHLLPPPPPASGGSSQYQPYQHSPYHSGSNGNNVISGSSSSISMTSTYSQQQTSPPPSPGGQTQYQYQYQQQQQYAHYADQQHQHYQSASYHQQPHHHNQTHQHHRGNSESNIHNNNHNNGNEKGGRWNSMKMMLGIKAQD